jgi:hypothetical protein
MWQFINSFADWFSGIGTIAAVIVALYLAAHDRRIILLPRATFITRNDGDVIQITVTNRHRRTTRTTAIYWKTGIFKRRLFYLSVADPLRNSSPLEIELNDGEQAQYDIAIFTREVNPA